MKKFILLLCALGVLACGCRTDRPEPVQPPDRSWASLPRLEKITKAYARRHRMAFDFATAHSQMNFDPQEPNAVYVTFYHGRHETFFQAKIDRNGKVIWGYPITPRP